MKLSLSCADFAFPMVKHEQSLDLIAMLGFKAVDIGMFEGRIQCSYADNRIDYNRIVRKLVDMGYKGHVCIEYVWIDWEHCNETDNLSETVLFRDFLRSV